MKPYDYLESEQTIIYEKRYFLTGNKEFLCVRDVLHPIIARKVKCIPGNLYNKMKEIFIKNCKDKTFWDYIQVKKFII